MSEPIKEITNQMITRIFNTLYGERKVVLRLIVMVIVFFKAFVTRLYVISLGFSQLIFVITAAVLISTFAFRSRYKLIASNIKIIFLYCSQGIGMFFSWASNKAWPIPEVSLFINKVDYTTRLNWVTLMCEWDNIVPSIYLIAYFVARIYLGICFLKAIGYMNDADNDMMNIREPWLNHTCQYAVVSVFCCGSWTYRIIHQLFLLLE